LSPDWQSRFQPGEALLWEGTPVPGFHQRGKALFLMIFGLPFLVIGIAAFFAGLHQLSQAADLSQAGLAVFLTAFSLPFAGIGGFLVFGPIFEARTDARHLRYALTNRAAYIWRAWPVEKVEVYPILPQTALELEKGKGADTVWLHARVERDSEGGLATVHIGFRNIAEGEKVFRLIREIQTGEPE
jgi:hypothetical protein